MILLIQFYYCKRFNGKFFVYYMALHQKSGIFGASGSGIKGKISACLQDGSGVRLVNSISSLKRIISAATEIPAKTTQTFKRTSKTKRRKK